MNLKDIHVLIEIPELKNKAGSVKKSTQWSITQPLKRIHLNQF